MTAINIVQKPGEVFVMTDGLGLRSGGSVQPSTKISMLAHVPLLVGVRGLSGLAQLLTTKYVAEQENTFDGFLSFLPSFAFEIVPQVSVHFGQPDLPHEIFVVGFSESRQRLETHFLATSDLYASRGRAAYTLHLETEPMTASPQPDADSIANARFVCPTVRKFEPADHGLKLMDAQRISHPDSIGGFMQVSRVTRDGISSRVVHRW